MKVLVTGATGFLGAHIIRRLLQDGHSVRILRRASSFTQDIDGLLFETAMGDITDPVAVRAAMHGIDWVIHAAAVISYWPLEEREIVRVNAGGTQCVAEAALAAGVKRLVYVSSVMAVGIPAPGTMGDETMAFNFDEHPNPYSTGKFVGERLLQEAVKRGLQAVTVNPGAIIGPIDRRRAVGGLFFPGKVNRYFYISGGMSAVDVEDVVDGIMRALERGRAGDRYLLTGEDVSYRKMREVIAAEMGEPKPCIPIPTAVLRLVARLADFVSRFTKRKPRISLPMAGFLPFELYYSSAKAQRELGWTYRPFSDSVKRAVAWYRSTSVSN